MISIIGGGPVGCYLAYILAKRGKPVQVFEEHSSIGKPVQCTGIVTSNISKIIDMDNSFVINRLNKTRIISPNNKSIEIGTDEYVIDRAKFDKHLADIAKEAGAKFHMNSKFIGVRGKNILIRGDKKINEFDSDILIGADGPISEVAKVSGIGLHNGNYLGIQARVKTKVDSNVFETYFGKEYPDFFGWVVPENDKIVRVGIASKDNAKEHFNRFIKKKFGKAKIIDKQGGLIPVYDPKIKTHNKRYTVYLVGDAALQVKATTGGGLIYGLLGARAVADSICFNKDYGKLWKKMIGKDLWLNLKIRNALNKMSDSDYNYLIKLMNSKRIKNVLSKNKRDFPSKFIAELLIKEPRFLYFVKLLF